MRGWRQSLAAGVHRALRSTLSSQWDLVLGGVRRHRPGSDEVVPQWGTVPFLAIWVSLTVIYGFRLWRLQPAILTLTVVHARDRAIVGSRSSTASRTSTTWPRSR